MTTSSREADGQADGSAPSWKEFIMLPIYQITDANLLLVVLLEDPPTHTNEHLFCSDPECPCKEDETLNRMFITKPLDNGLLTNSEALRLYFGTQLTLTQDDEPTSDEEIEQIMNEPSPLDVDIEENYHRSFFDGLDPDDLDDHPF